MRNLNQLDSTATFGTNSDWTVVYAVATPKERTLSGTAVANHHHQTHSAATPLPYGRLGPVPSMTCRSAIPSVQLRNGPTALQHTTRTRLSTMDTKGSEPRKPRQPVGPQRTGNPNIKHPSELRETLSPQWT